MVFDSVELRKRQMSHEESGSPPAAPLLPSILTQSEQRDSDEESLTSTSTVKPADLDQLISPATYNAPALPDSAPRNIPGPFSADSAFDSEDHVFEMYTTPPFRAPYDSDYQSESDSDSEIDLTSLLEKVSAPSAPVHQLWFMAEPPAAEPPPTKPSPTRPPPTNSKEEQASSSSYKPPWVDEGEIYKGSGVVSLASQSVIGDLLAPVVSTHVPRGELRGAHLEGPSPDDIVRLRQESVFNTNRKS